MQIVLLNVDYQKESMFITQYGCSISLNDTEAIDNLTGSLFRINELNLAALMVKKHSVIDINHPVQKISGKKSALRITIPENYSCNPEYPVYLSYTEDDFIKVVGERERNDHRIYYVICDKQSTGSISYEKIKFLNLYF